MEKNNYEISLKNLFLILWRRKFIIIATTLIISLLAGLFSMFFIEPVYNSKIDIVINMPEKFNTRYGEFILPVTTNQQYIGFILSNDVLINTLKDMGYDTKGVSVETLRSKIQIGYIDMSAESRQNNYDVSVSANNPKEVKKLADTLYENYIDFLDVMIKERAILHYYDQFSVQIKALQNKITSNNKILEENEKLLQDMPQTINQKEAMNDIANLIDTNDFVVLENIINENYTKLEEYIITLRQTIITDENTIVDCQRYLEELEIDKKAINKFYTEENQDLTTSIIGIVDDSIYMPSSAIEPTVKTSPNNTVNSIIGAIIGFMISILFILVKEYWFLNNDNSK